NGDSNPQFLTNLNGTLFFAATDNGVANRELWKSDGSQGGTTVAANINPSGSSNPQDLTPFQIGNNFYLFFSATDGTHGRELWIYEASSGTAFMAADINPGGDANPTGFVKVNNVVYFSADDGSHGRELWSAVPNGDGTATVSMISDINPISGNGSSIAD